MSKELPYMATAGTLPKILDKIIEASVPESFNYDFLGTKLGFKGGNQRTFVSWAKKCGFLTQDGTPTAIYKNFRNPDSRGAAMSQAIKVGYEELYTRNEYAHELSDKDLKQLICDITGKPHDNSTVSAIVATYKNAKAYADFDAKPTKEITKLEEIIPANQAIENPLPTKNHHTNLKLGLNYTINLVLPKTDDPAIYDAIFKSLKENLLNE